MEENIEKVFAYEIDYDKIESIEDVKKILKLLNFSFTKAIIELEGLEHLTKLKEDESRDK